MTFPSKALTLFDGTRTIVSGFVGMMEGIFTDTVTRLAPILAPLPPAFSVYTAMAKAQTPYWIALCTALAVELIGMFSSKVAIQSWNWNRSRLKTEPVAPFTLTVAMAAVYFIVVLVLALSIEIWTQSLIILYPGFVIIAAATYVSNAINGDLSAWQRKRNERLQQQKEKRGLGAEIKTAREQLAELTIELEKTRDETHDLTEAAAADLETIRTETADLTEAVARLKAQKRRLNATPATTTTDTTEQARVILTEVWRNGSDISGAELGRQLKRSGTLGRKLKNELWPEISAGATNGVAETNGVTQ